MVIFITVKLFEVPREHLPAPDIKKVLLEKRANMKFMVTFTHAELRKTKRLFDLLPAHCREKKINH